MSRTDRATPTPASTATPATAGAPVTRPATEGEAARFMRLGLPIAEIESDEEFRFALAHKLLVADQELGTPSHPQCPLARCRRARMCRGTPHVYHALPCADLPWPEDAAAGPSLEEAKAIFGQLLKQRLQEAGRGHPQNQLQRATAAR